MRAIRIGMVGGGFMARTYSFALSAVHGLACRALGIRHLRTRPYRPQTNGKAERFIQTLTNG